MAATYSDERAERFNPGCTFLPTAGDRKFTELRPDPQVRYAYSGGNLCPKRKVLSKTAEDASPIPSTRLAGAARHDQ